MDTLTTSSLPGMQTFTTSSLPGVESMSSESEGEEFVPTISPITAFYKDKSVFITGGTGFMGKVRAVLMVNECPGAGGEVAAEHTSGAHLPSHPAQEGGVHQGAPPAATLRTHI